MGSTIGRAGQESIRDIQRGLRKLNDFRLNSSGLYVGLRDFETKAMGTARRVGQAMANALGGSLGAGGRVVKGLGGGIGLGKLGGAAAIGQLGADAIKYAAGKGGDLVKGANSVEEAANRISIGSRQAGQGFVDPKQLAAEFFAVAQQVKGIEAEAAADAASRFVTLTGDLETARKSLKDFAEVASATGANVGDVAEAAASISQQFGLTDPKEIREVLAALTFQGKAGSFELKDAAAQFQRLAASGASFGLPKTAQGVKTLGGLTQIARSATGSGEQAATAVENLFTNLKTKLKDLTAAGVKVYDKGKTRDVQDIIVEAISKVGGADVAQKQAGLSKIFGEQGIRAINPLISLYNDTFASAKGSNQAKTAAAMEALRSKINEATNAAGDWNEILKDSAQAQTSNSAKLTAAWENLQSKVAEAVLPQLTTFIDELAKNPEILKAFGDAILFTGKALRGLLLTLGLIEEKKGSSSFLADVDEERERLALQKQIDSPENKAAIAEFERTKGLRRAHKAAMSMPTTEGFEALSAAFEDEERLKAALNAARFGGASPAASPATVPGKVDIGNEVRVRVVNPQDLKSPGAPSSGGSSLPAPGWMPRL
ncbi:MULTISPECIES: phage tail tape measure protein [Sorangium]|nr:MULTISPECIES: phage tail tape measure protein [Sorangium]